MPLLNPDQPESQMGFLEEASAYFLRAIKQHYTRDTAVEVMEALTPILGKDWKGMVIFGIMSNKYQGIRSIRIQRTLTRELVRKINAIKEVRGLSGLGLVEAKNLVEQAYDAPQTVTIMQARDGEDQRERERIINAGIQAIRDAGFHVEIA